MSQASRSVRLLSRRNLDKADVEAAYADIVKAVGGTYFLNGVSQVAGAALDWRNFSREAGITNAYRSLPNSLFQLRIQDNKPNGLWSAYTAVPLRAPVPATPTSTAFTVVAWNLSWTKAAAADALPTAATWTLNRIAAGTGTSTQISQMTQANVASIGASDCAAGAITGLSFTVFSGDQLQLVPAITTAGTGSAWFFQAGIWLTARHVA